MKAPLLPLQLVTELHSFGCTTYPRVAQRWDEHVHAYHQFDATLSGEAFLTVEGRRVFRYTAGVGLLIPPLVRHFHRTEKGFRVAMFFFQASPKAWPLLGSRPMQFRLSKEALRMIERAGGAKTRKELLFAEEGAAVLSQCLIEGLRARKGAGTAGHEEARSSFWRILERVERDPFAPWSVAKLAAECHLSADHFTRAFKRALRQTPLDYLQHCRLRAAANALAADERLTIKEAAELAGYGSVHAFTRAFRRVIAATPAAFRRIRPTL
jgi:AraC-like DNA-binding protein